jgi:hypothetical protein
MESLEQCKIKALRRGVPSRKKRWEAVLGIVAAGAFIWDLYTDSHHYMGNDFNKAATVTAGVLITGILVGTALTGIGLPTGAVIVGSAIVETMAGTATMDWILMEVTNI